MIPLTLNPYDVTSTMRSLVTKCKGHFKKKAQTYALQFTKSIFAYLFNYGEIKI